MCGNAPNLLQSYDRESETLYFFQDVDGNQTWRELQEKTASRAETPQPWTLLTASVVHFAPPSFDGNFSSGLAN